VRILWRNDPPVGTLVRPRILFARSVEEESRYIVRVSPTSSCEQCGFVWDAIRPTEIPDRLRAATETFVAAIADAREFSSTRPSDERWSVNEYGAHLRDVLISIRDRIIAASVQERPTGSPIYRDQRVSLGFYKQDSAHDVASELTAMSNLFIRTFESLPTNYEQREFIFSPITPNAVTILWASAQALHEAEHHLGDVQENLRLLRVL